MNAAKKDDLVLYEYFQTDRAGHDKNLKDAIAQINKLEELIIGILDRMVLQEMILIVVSDHGNMEDLRTKSHTRNPAFCAVWNNGDNDSLHSLKSITDIYPYIMESLTGKKKIKKS